MISSILSVFAVWCFIGLTVNIYLYVSNDKYYRAFMRRKDNAPGKLPLRFILMTTLCVIAVVLWPKILRSWK